MSGGGGQEVSQTQSEPGGVVEGAMRAAKRTHNREEWWQPNALRAGRSGGGGQESNETHSEPGNTLRAGRSGGGGQEGSQTHSEPGGVVEGYVTMTSSQ